MFRFSKKETMNVTYLPDREKTELPLKLADLEAFVHLCRDKGVSEDSYVRFIHGGVWRNGYGLNIIVEVEAINL